MMTNEEYLNEIVAGATTLDKQEIMNIVCDALKTDRIEVSYVPQDLINYANQMIGKH